MRQNTGSILIKFFKAGFAGLIVGLLLALLLNRWVWLEMRINIGAIIPGSIVFFLILAFWKCSVSLRLLLSLEAMLLVAFFSLYGLELEALRIVPACMFREGCHVTSLNINSVSMFLGAVFILGNSILIFSRLKSSSITG